MSTRATYTIDGHRFYIHYDGYPEGAAAYFNDAVVLGEHRRSMDYIDSPYSPNASFADDFVRANPRSELIHNPEAHADTEYHYTVQTEGDFRFGPSKLLITGYYRSPFASGWTEFFTGTVEDFIDHCQRGT